MTHFSQDSFARKTISPAASKTRCSHTIVIPTKDRPRLLARALASAQQERGQTGEIVVIDDHSAAPVTCAGEGMRVIRLTDGQSGVAAARNAGINAARGCVIFFLDDDDWFVPGYCERVLSGAAQSHDYGFSSYLEVRGGHPEKAGKVRFAEGPIPRRAPLRKQLCGFGMGFWIRRSVADEIGPVDHDLTINEDTDFVCRLILANKSAWYSATPGVTIFRDESARADLGHLTSRTSSQERARCMRLLCERYPNLLPHLGKSYLRHCVKAGRKQDAMSFLGGIKNFRLRLNLTIFTCMKLVALCFRVPQPAPRAR